MASASARCSFLTSQSSTPLLIAAPASHSRASMAGGAADSDAPGRRAPMGTPRPARAHVRCRAASEASPVPVQMWAVVGGVSPVPVQMWAVVGGVSPVPMQMRAVVGGLSPVPVQMWEVLRPCLPDGPALARTTRAAAAKRPARADGRARVRHRAVRADLTPHVACDAHRAACNARGRAWQCAVPCAACAVDRTHARTYPPAPPPARSSRARRRRRPST